MKHPVIQPLRLKGAAKIQHTKLLCVIFALFNMARRQRGEIRTFLSLFPALCPDGMMNRAQRQRRYT